jgi:hypothetical protein
VDACAKILPLLPVIVRVRVFFPVPEILLTMSTDDPEPVNDEGLKVAVSLFDNPLMVNVTFPVNPDPGVFITV